jgi:hypothetical protein
MAAKVSAESPDLALGCGVFFLLLGLVFVWRSFYAMRIEAKKVD